MQVRQGLSLSSSVWAAVDEWRETIGKGEDTQPMAVKCVNLLTCIQCCCNQIRGARKQATRELRQHSIIHNVPEPRIVVLAKH